MVLGWGGACGRARPVGASGADPVIVHSVDTTRPCESRTAQWGSRLCYPAPGTPVSTVFVRDITTEMGGDMAKIGDHAVVLGASMAGLLAARALSDFFETVTVVERDALPDNPASRRGVPQGRHPHGLLTRGAHR